MDHRASIYRPALWTDMKRPVESLARDRPDFWTELGPICGLVVLEDSTVNFRGGVRVGATSNDFPLHSSMACQVIA